MDLGEYSSVIEAADIALENNPDDYDLKMLKAQALAFAGEYMEALWLVEELANENHEDMELWKLIEYIKMHIRVYLINITIFHCNLGLNKFIK